MTCDASSCALVVGGLATTRTQGRRGLYPLKRQARVRCAPRSSREVQLTQQSPSCFGRCLLLLVAGLFEVVYAGLGCAPELGASLSEALRVAGLPE